MTQDLPSQPVLTIEPTLEAIIFIGKLSFRFHHATFVRIAAISLLLLRISRHIYNPCPLLAVMPPALWRVYQMIPAAREVISETQEVAHMLLLSCHNSTFAATEVGLER